MSYETSKTVSYRETMQFIDGQWRRLSNDELPSLPGVKHTRTKAGINLSQDGQLLYVAGWEHIHQLVADDYGRLRDAREAEEVVQQPRTLAQVFEQEHVLETLRADVECRSVLLPLHNEDEHC